ncbi:MAG TPA: LuxR C-terminal-related transcriptional regulator [Streptosporangiaceae bacterium]|nr:LuxR C-terminal-related transcriptional regulator [Streptosporangiaceae bacterium]
MAETTAGGRPDESSPGPDLLLRTKLHVPRSRPGLVARPRLAAQLEEGLTRGLVLVAAPAGYGKSVLLSEWARSTGQPVAWLSLDEGDNDPVRFWRHVLAALDGLRPGIAARVGPLTGSPPPSAYEALVTALINDFMAEPDLPAVLLVLDDYHVIGSAGVHTPLRFLFEHRPPQLRIALASRSDPSLGLARYRARGELGEVRAADLKFNLDEAAELLREVVAELDLPAVAALAERTEGWAVGLQLAALSLRNQPDIARFVAAFTGSHRYILDYLGEEILERQRPELRDFLLETSVLERLSGSLCDAVTGRHDSQQLLEEVDRSGLFVVQLDDIRGWWRYHHLFADLLRVRLEPDAERTRRLHRRAAAWYEQHGLPDDTIRHALAAQEQEWAARLVEEHFDTVFNLRGEQATIQSWLPALAPDVVRGRPRLLLAQAQMASMRGDLATMEPLLNAAGQVIGQAQREPFAPAAGPESSLLVNAPAMLALQRSYAAQLRGDAEATAARTREAMELVGENELMLASAVEGFVAMADWLRGRLDAAEEIFEASIGRGHGQGQVTTTAWGFYCLARLQRGRGRLEAAVETGARALAAIGDPGPRPRPAAGPALVGLAEIAYQRDDLDRAAEYVTEGIALCRQFVHTPPLAAGLVTLAWIRQASGDPAGAAQAMAEAEAVSLGPGGLLNPTPAQGARLRLAQGDLGSAARWAADAGLDPDDQPDYPREPGHLVLARVLLADHHPDQALALLDRLDRAAAAQHRTGSLIEIRVLRARARAGLGDDDGATATLTAALQASCGQGYVRVFADEGPSLATILGRLIAAQRDDRGAAAIPLPYLARVQSAFGAASTAPAGTGRGRAAPGLAVELTRRELEILALLAAGQSNQSIASHLFISLDTVKKHVSHVLSKLGAANRTEAVTRGRELGLLGR